MNLNDLPFRDIWACDFEFVARDGERPVPVSMVAKDLKSGRLVRTWITEFTSAPPFPIDESSLFVSYYAGAEFACFRVLNWPMPKRILDLYAEFRCVMSGLQTLAGYSLLGAMMAYGLDAITTVEKEEMRRLILRGPPFSNDEKDAILAYNETDVAALEALLPAMLAKSHIDLPRALLRGRYLANLSMVEHLGVPIDTATLASIRDNWALIQEGLIKGIDGAQGYNVYEGRSFREKKWAEWLAASKIPWPRLDSGRLDLSSDTFRQMARSHPQVAPMAELRHALSELRLNDLAVGSDGRNRCMLSPFASKTGRNQPSNSKFIFGPATWLRSLIKPTAGMALAYCDYSQQEFAIAAVLSGDSAMAEAYQSGDPYLTFAKQAGAVPPDATKGSHPVERDRFKTCALAVQYGQGPRSLADRAGIPEVEANMLLNIHRSTYPRYWQWSDDIEAQAMLGGTLTTCFGWLTRAGPDANPRSLRNFPVQATGAEVMRMAVCLGIEAGLMIVAPVHDAFLVEAAIDDIDHAVTQTQAVMAEASRIVLNGFELRSDVNLVRYPDRYTDKRGKVMWATVQQLLEEKHPLRL